jgi:hypothetical protein
MQLSKSRSRALKVGVTAASLQCSDTGLEMQRPASHWADGSGNGLCTGDANFDGNAAVSRHCWLGLMMNQMSVCIFLLRTRGHYVDVEHGWLGHGLDVDSAMVQYGVRCGCYRYMNIDSGLRTRLHVSMSACKRASEVELCLEAVNACERVPGLCARIG